MKVLITGGCGFIGHHLVDHILKNTDWEIVIFDKLSYAANGFDRLREIGANWPRVTTFPIDLNMPVSEGVQKETGEVDYIFHLAADSHVDNSIADPRGFIFNNVHSTVNILEFARTQKNLKMFVNFSSDEVYGTAPKGHAFKEKEYHFPSNPYSASKSSQEAIGIAYSNTYGVPVISIHCMNAFGERQHAEKYVPLVVNKILNKEKLYIHAYHDKKEAGSRSYIHARNIAAALLHIIDLGYKGYDEWNIGGEQEIDNHAMAVKIATVVGKPLQCEFVNFSETRPGHDLRYALDCSKLLQSGFKYPDTFEESFKNTIQWILTHPEWRQ